MAVIIVFYRTFKMERVESTSIYPATEKKGKEKLSLHARTGNCFKMSTWPKIKERKREGE